MYGEVRLSDAASIDGIACAICPVEITGSDRVVALLLIFTPRVRGPLRISPDNLNELFGSFFTTKRQGMGSAWQSANPLWRHGGSLAARNNELGGATFEVVLPIFAPQPESVAVEVRRGA
ncbi:hypothetical protein AB8A31_28810 [Tardiphaga sp. 804_B3_N1_9]|uniref:hypothetical protein n=1 Tax=Tardiphaga TaxID=1395974 RepID=UPI0015861077|nr:hypothetical protein [Tardiphaga robiniae]